MCITARTCEAQARSMVPPNSQRKRGSPPPIMLWSTAPLMYNQLQIRYPPVDWTSAQSSALVLKRLEQTATKEHGITACHLCLDASLGHVAHGS